MLSRFRDRMNPYRLYLGIEAAMAFLVSLAYTTSVIYWVRSGHLNPLDLVLLGTVLEVAYFVLQLPTGVLADVVSRRLCVIAGVFLDGAGFLMQGLSPDFAVLLVAQVPIGLGAALMVGAQEAWLADELARSELTSIFLRATQLGLLGTIAGSILSGFVALAGLNLPFVVSGTLIGIVGVVLVCVMPEKNFRPAARAARTASAAETVLSIRPGGIVRQAWGACAGQTGRARTAMVAVPALVLLLGMTFFTGLWSESFDRLWGDYFLTDIGFPRVLHLSTVTWFSVLAVAVALLGLLSTQAASRMTSRLGPSSVVGILLAFVLMTAIAVVGMSLARSFGIAVLGYLIVATIRPVLAPLITGWMVARVEPEIRATALSAVDLFDSGGQILGGPVIGAVGLLVSVRIALLAGAAAFVPAIGLLVAATKRLRAHPDGSRRTSPSRWHTE